MTDSNDQNSILLNLPAEIRQMIYGLVLQKDGPIMLCGRQGRFRIHPDMDCELFHFPEEACNYNNHEIESKLSRAVRKIPAPDPTSEVLHTSLLEVCKQINDEATPLLYSRNMMVVSRNCLHDDPHWPEDFDNAHHLKRLTIWVKPELMGEPHLWLHASELIILAAGSISRVTVLFQADVYDMDGDKYKQALVDLRTYISWFHDNEQHSIDVGFYPSLRDAFQALSHSYR